MAKHKGITISLAAKCQLLFGLAVLVIIAGALAVPWQRMEQLAKQPNIKAARFAADIVFRQAHTNKGAVPAARPTTEPPAAPSSDPTAPPDTTPAPSTARAVVAASGWDSASLLDTSYPQPHIFVATAPAGGLSGGGDRIANNALRTFRDHPQETEYGEMETLKDPAAGTTGLSRVYRYAAAIRLDASCLACHGEFAAWVPSSPLGVRATLPATLAVGTATAPAAAGLGANGPVVGVVRVDVPYQTDEDQLLLNRIVIVVAGMLGGALAIVVFYLITSRLILQPVRVLKNTAEKVSGGDLNIRSAISTGDEFQHLSETFNTMLANLQASRDQLQATNTSLDTRVGELAQSNVDLFEANRLKSEFLTNVTHELRTPLNAIIGFADLLGETAAKTGDPKQQRYAENIHNSAKQLLDLINDLLDLAKIEAGKLVLRQEKVNVADRCEALANFMRPLAQKKEIALELALDPQMPLITTDPGRFQQILYNFLSNAIKFTPNEGRVTISARGEHDPLAAGAGELVGLPPSPSPSAAASADSADLKAQNRELITPNSALRTPNSELPPPTAIRIAITDTGPGISAEDQKVIFEKFRQLDGSVTRHHSGSGLGLAISRELANMLGGRIELQSAPGKGATFALIVPVHLHRGPVEVHAMLENR